jgi:hypothetical protein
MVVQSTQSVGTDTSAMGAMGRPTYEYDALALIDQRFRRET